MKRIQRKDPKMYEELMDLQTLIYSDVHEKIAVIDVIKDLTVKNNPEAAWEKLREFKEILLREKKTTPVRGD